MCRVQDDVDERACYGESRIAVTIVAASAVVEPGVSEMAVSVTDSGTSGGSLGAKGTSST